MSSELDPGPNLEAGFSQVDAQPDAALLVAGMDATAQWPAVRQLRAWEQERLGLRPGQRLLDVGCGLGEVVTSLAAILAPGGDAVGLDASEVMLGEARRRAPAGVPVRFAVGDALALTEADSSFDACRTERMLQWVHDVEAAVAEMVRVVRPGGRLSLIDTDWRSFVADLPDTEASLAMTRAMSTYRGANAAAGGRLLNVCRDAGLVDLECTAAAHVWTSWDPDTEPAPSGLFPLESVVPQLADAGLIDQEMAARFVDGAVAAGRGGRICFSLTMLAVAGRLPGG